MDLKWLWIWNEVSWYGHKHDYNFDVLSLVNIFLIFQIATHLLGRTNKLWIEIDFQSLNSFHKTHKIFQGINTNQNI